MFNRDFYPTPDAVIERMLFPVDIRGKVILEPSAGKGNIVDYLQKNGAREVIACELNGDLARIVSGKCRLLADDFLKVTSDQISHVDMIMMNPPFSAEEAHILHAWDIAPEGCTIISLCNSSVVLGRHYYTEKQKQVQEYIEMYGQAENFGECFTDAERKTDVSVACLWLYKPKTGEHEFDDYFSLDEEVEAQADGLIQHNYVREIVNRYTGAIKMFDQIMPLAQQINELTKPISEYGIKFGAFRAGKTSYGDRQITREEYKKELQKQCWRKVFEDMNMDKYVTKGVREKINKFVEMQTHVPFTMRNIYRMLEIIADTHGNRMQQVIVEAFETICRYSWKDNCTGGEHWKTNSDYMVNRRFIVPGMCSYQAYSSYYHQHVNITSYGEATIEDVTKAICYLTGTDYNSIQPLYAFVKDTTNVQGTRKHLSQSEIDTMLTPMEWGKWYEWGFFRIRGYKKGTMHFEFQTEELWMQFNRRVAEIKGWALPQSTRKARAKATDMARL